MSRNNVSSSSNRQTIKSNIQQPCNSWVFLTKENINGTDYENDIVRLKHPNNGETGAFLFSQDNRYVQEILTYMEDKRSWFIDDSVKSDGAFKISTPIDPIFLVLPYLRDNSESSATLLDQLLHDDKYPETKRLLECDGLKYLTCVADKTVLGDIIAYKYNETKTLRWLKRKTDNLVRILKLNNIHLTSDATSATFKKTKCESLHDNVYLRYAVEIVSEYLFEDLSRKLAKYVNLPDAVVVPHMKRKSDVIDMHDSKKHKATAFMETSPPKQTVKRAMVKSSKLRSATAKNKTKATGSTTTQTITSFFKKSF